MDNGIKYSSSRKRRSRTASLDKRKARSGWIFVLPFILGLLLIYIPVIIDSFKYSLSSITYDQQIGNVVTFVGLENYQEALFEDTSYVRTLTSGIVDLIIDIPIIVIFSLFIAVILNQKVLGRAVFRTIFFIPVICATGIMGSIAAATQSFNDMMADQSQSINTGELSGGFTFGADMITDMFESMKIGTEIADYVIGAVNGISSIIERSGVQMLIFLAALQSISPAIYESCSIDGATTWETFWKITLPMISPMILVNSIYTVIDSFTSSSNKVMQYISGTYVENAPLSAAMAWMYFGIIILIVIAVAAVMKAYVFYQKRDA
jgi:ABC-type sugar transport system permease subunit